MTRLEDLYARLCLLVGGIAIGAGGHLVLSMILAARANAAWAIAYNLVGEGPSELVLAASVALTGVVLAAVASAFLGLEGAA